MINSSLFTSNDHTWETPKYLFDKLDSVFNFNTDVCALSETAKCKNYFTPIIDGLKQEWKNTCWMNPPYGREQVKWINKAFEDSKKYSNQIVCLIPARPDTRVWHEVVFPNAKAVCFIKGRIKFGDSNASAPFPSAIVVFGNINKEQVECLETLGRVYL